jgi:hypothetical protein
LNSTFIERGNMAAKYFGSIKNTMQRAKALRTLLAIAAGAANGVYLSEKDIALVNGSEPTLFETNPTIKDAAGNVAIRVTAAGATAATEMQAEAAAKPAAAVEAVASAFLIEDGFAVPPKKKGGARGNKYPFDAMQVGQSFFVAATEAKPNPSKSLASTISSATKRYKDQTPARKFQADAVTETRTVNGTSVQVSGARVWRIA